MDKHRSWNADAGVGDYLAIMRRQWITIAVTLALVMAAVVAYTLTAEEVYESTSTVLLEPSDANGSGASAAPPVNNALEVLSSRTISARVGEALGADAELVRDASFSIVGDSDVVSIAVRSTSPTVARLAADAYSAAFVAWRTETANVAAERNQAAAAARVDMLVGEIARLDATIAQLEAAGAIVDGEPVTGEASAVLSERQVYEGQLANALENRVQSETQPEVSASVRQLDPAQLPTAPVSPRLRVNLVVGAIVGLFAAIGLALLRDLFDDHIRDTGELGAIADAPVLAAVPAIAGRRRGRSQPLPTLRDQASPAVESYRFLAARVVRGAIPGSGRTVLFTGASSGDGCSTTLANTAVILARAGHRVLVVDANVRQPAQHSIFGVSSDAAQLGLSTVLAHDADPGSLLHDSGIDVAGELYLLPAGACPPEPTALFDADGMSQLLERLAGGFDHILLDGPPVLETADSMLLAPCVDGVVVAASMQRTKRRALRNALDRLEQFGAKIIGVVATVAEPGDAPGPRTAPAEQAGGQRTGRGGDRGRPAQPAEAEDVVVVGAPVVRPGRAVSRS